MARNIELYPALPISSTSIQRNHEHGNTDTAKSDLSRSELFGGTSYVPVSGGVTLAGTAAIARTLVVSVSGGVTLGGSAATSEIAVYTATASGGVTLNGAAALARTYALIAAGGTVLSGAAETSFLSTGATEYPYTSSGGVALGGSGNAMQIRLPIGPDYVIQPMRLYDIAPLIIYDAPKPEPPPKPKPKPKTFTVSGAVIVSIGGNSLTQMRSNWIAPVLESRFYIGGGAVVSRTYAVPIQDIQPPAIRRRQKQEDALLLAL